MTFQTRIPIEECKARLASGIDAERIAVFSWSGFAGSRAILGKLRDNKFRLRRRRYYRNSFGLFFFGRFVDFGRGTRIEGEFRMDPFARAYLIVWFSFMGLLSVVGLIFIVSGGRGGLVLLMGSAASAVLVFAIMKFSWWLCRNEKKAIVAFLKSTFETEANDDALQRTKS